MAFMDNKDFVSPDHVMKVVPSVLGHRIIMSYEASLDNLDSRVVARKSQRNTFRLWI